MKHRQGLTFVSFLAVMLLVGFVSVDSGLADPPAKPSSPAANTFEAVAKDIEKIVRRLGYPKSTADALVEMVRGWKLEQWKHDLVQARATASSPHSVEVGRIEGQTIRLLYSKLGLEFDSSSKNDYYFYLSVALKNRKMNCLGFSQLFYILGNALGIRVRVVDVLEQVSGPSPAGDGHVACLASRSDGKVMMVDLGQNFVSRPFVFEEVFVNSDNHWKLKRQNNLLRIHRRIQVLNERELIGVVYNNLGCASLKAGNYVRALSYLNKAVKFNPKNAEAFTNRGNAYYRQGQIQQAMSDFSKAIELAPIIPMTFYNRGIAYLDMGHNKQAISDFNKAIELDPIFAKAFSDRGVAYDKLGQHQQAMSDFNKAIELDPKFAKAFTCRGYANIRCGRYQEAMPDFNKAIEFDPKLILAYINRGIASAILGKKDDAKRDLKKVLELDPAKKAKVQKISDKFKLGL